MALNPLATPHAALEEWVQRESPRAVTSDSRTVTDGCVFVAVRGERTDGHVHLSQAVAAGAAVLVVERQEAVPPDFHGTLWVVPDSRKALARLARWSTRDPQRELELYGVTGTNGKTTTTHLIEQLLHAQGKACGVIGTIDHHLGKHVWPTQLTTPDVVTLFQRLREMRDHKADAVSMEVSSHALEQGRTEGLRFRSVVFTNLSRDHLDYHGTMESYFGAKARLFEPALSERRVICVDDEWGARLASQAPCVTYGQTESAGHRWTLRSQSPKGTEFQLTLPTGEQLEFRTPLLGSFNIANIVGAILAVAPTLDRDGLRGLRTDVAQLRGVKGRLEKVPVPNGCVFIDYAHTPEALSSALHVLRETQMFQAIHVVFGCGGDRDRGKRPQMMAAALAGADRVIVTSDNPRTEDPESIIQDILASADPQAASRVKVEVDRRRAIQSALETLGEGVALLVAGKGHEAYQEVHGVRHPFSDHEVVAEYFQRGPT